MSEWTRRPRLLQGVRLLEIGDGTADFCANVLADLGAEVKKLQSGAEDDLLSLIQEVDGLLVEGDADRLARWRVSLQDLRIANPRLIFISVSAFGWTGPRRGWRSSDLVVSAAGGQVYINGEPEREPLPLPGSQALHLGALHAAVGVVLALLQRDATGQGARVDVSLQEAVASGLDHVLVRYFADGAVPARSGSRQWNDSTVLVPCLDGYLLVFPFLQWATLAEWMAADGAAEDLARPLPEVSEGRREAFDRIHERISRWTSLRTRAELFDTAQAMGLPWASVCTPAEVRDSPQLRERRFFEPAGEGGRVRAGPPYLFSATPGQASGARRTRRGNPRATTAVRPGGPLSGVRVLDFTRVLAGPLATRILGDFGAEVIKVQTKKTVGGAEADDQAYFAMWNRNKLSVTVDLDHPEGRDVIMELVQTCDVVAENFSPRVLDNWALGHEVLQEANAELIVLRMSAAGQSGPWRDTVAFGPTIHALSGLTHLTAYPGGPPIGPGFAYSDVVAGLYGALAVVSALYDRRRTGLGLCIDLSEYEAVVSLLDPAHWLADAGVGPGSPQQELEESGAAAPYGCFRCRGEDRWCAIAVSSEDQWHTLCTILGASEMGNDPRFAGADARRHHAVELRALLEMRTALHDAGDLAERLQDGGIPAAPVADARDLAQDQHLNETGFFVAMRHPKLGEFVSDRGAIRLEGWESPLRPAPLLGEHNEEVFRKVLGWSKAKLAAMRDRGVIS